MASRTKTIYKGFQVETRNLLILPKGYRSDRTYPMLTALHGMGMTAEEFSDLLAPLQDLPVILFVPQGVYPFEIRVGEQMRIGRAWYLYTGDETEFVQSMSVSGRHLRTLVDRVVAETVAQIKRRARNAPDDAKIKWIRSEADCSAMIHELPKGTPQPQQP